MAIVATLAFPFDEPISILPMSLIGRLRQKVHFFVCPRSASYWATLDRVLLKQGEMQPGREESLRVGFFQAKESVEKTF